MKKVISTLFKSIYASSITCLVVLLAASCSHKSNNISSSQPTDIQWKSPNATEKQENTSLNQSTKDEFSATAFKESIKEEAIKNNSGKALSPKQEKALDKLANNLAKKFNKLSPEKKQEIKEKAEQLKLKAGLKNGLITAFIGICIMILGNILFWLSVLSWLGWLIYIIGAIVFLYGIYLILMEVL